VKESNRLHEPALRSCEDGVDIKHRPLRLRLYPDSVLRETAEPIRKADRHVAALAKDMLALMQTNHGIGLAAPQVGLPVRLIVADVGEGALAVVNPILVAADASDWMSEGCLSIPGVFVEIERKTSIEVRGGRPDGGKLHFEATGLLARVIQHEVDHLQGVLIWDYVSFQRSEDQRSHKVRRK
jgi:peptide deformylase